jgi:hypothetical protein
MAPNRWWLLALIVPHFALAQVDRSPLKIKTPSPQFDLLKESDSIAVFKEQSVQKEEPASRHVLTVSFGEVSANSLTLTSNNQIVRYDLSQPVPFLGGTLGYYPARFGGYWGLLSSINYAYREQHNPLADSALHLFATDVLISYRHETSAQSWFKPFVGVGPGINVVIQRGVDELNTSEAKGLVVGVIGAGFNLKRAFNMSSPLDWELTAQYKRWFDGQPSNVNYNGQMLSLGVSMLL